jgi:hypothetical protein
MTRGDKCLKIQKQLAIHTSLALGTVIASAAKQFIIASHKPTPRHCERSEAIQP